MKVSDISTHRLINQQVLEPKFKKPEALVSWMGAVQAQDFGGVKWAIGQRVKGATDASVEQAFNDGAVLRTHVLRPTWHFVTPADIRWMVSLTAPRINTTCASQYRNLGLNDMVFNQSNKVLTKALRDGNHLTRVELAKILEQAKIETNDIRMTHLMMRAELDMVVCSGIKQEKQFTYALFEERVPPVKAKKPDEALAELSLRYFKSKGPATLQDYVWWSGLSVVDAKKSLELSKSQLLSETIEGIEYWMGETNAKLLDKAPAVYLLPAFDEYTIAYKNRDAAIDPKLAEQTGNGIFVPTIVHNGKIIGTWKRLVKGGRIEMEINPFKPLSKTVEQQVMKAIKTYSEFMEMEKVEMGGKLINEQLELV